MQDEWDFVKKCIKNILDERYTSIQNKINRIEVLLRVFKSNNYRR